MTDSEFLDDLEARVKQEWTDEETHRLWSLTGYRMPPPDIRQIYARLHWRRAELINEVRTELVERTIKRLDE